MEPSPNTTTDRVYPNLKPFKAGPEWTGNRAGRRAPSEQLRDAVAKECGEDYELFAKTLSGLAFGAHGFPKVRHSALELIAKIIGIRKDVDVNLNGSLTTFDPARLARLSDSELEYVAGILRKLREGDDASGQ